MATKPTIDIRWIMVMSKSQAAYMMKGGLAVTKLPLTMEYAYQVMSSILIGQIAKACLELLVGYKLQISRLKAGEL